MICVPTIDDLTRDLSLAAGLPIDAVSALLAELAMRQQAISAVGTALAASLVMAQRKSSAAFETDDEMLEPDAAAELLHKSRQWLFRHKHRLPFVRVLSRKSLLCSKIGLLKWLAAQKT